MNAGIQYISHAGIDKQKWDNCIRQAENGLIYAYSFYLDCMARNWDALVLNDYEAVMPVTWKKKWGIHYLYQPFLTAQLGLFGNTLTADLCSQFIHAIPARFRLVEISLNSKNRFDLNGIPLMLRSNYVLRLEDRYEEISGRYNNNTKRNFRKAQQQDFYFQKDVEVEKLIRLATAHMKKSGAAIKDNLHRFRKLYAVLKEKNMAATYGIMSGSGELLASCVFFFSHQRAYYILVGNSHSGRYTGASAALIDEFIRMHAGKNILLDFEGSDIPGLANFYRGFGAQPEPYPALRQNRLPFFLKWLR